jgi:hypothetical protein
MPKMTQEQVQAAFEEKLTFALDAIMRNLDCGHPISELKAAELLIKYAGFQPADKLEVSGNIGVSDMINDMVKKMREKKAAEKEADENAGD